MDKVREKHARSEVDWISNLPEDLLCQVLLNLPTKDVVKTSVLSHRWKNLWKYVPGLDFDNADFATHNIFVNFVDSILGLNSESYLQSFKLIYNEEDEPEVGLTSRLLNTVVVRKPKHIDVLDESCWSWDVHMPTILYTCESLVSLKLSCVTLPSPIFVSLPSLKIMDLDLVIFADKLAFETLVSGCPVLERLIIEMSVSDDTQVLRVLSQSLLSFSYSSDGDVELVGEQVLAIDAPRLKYLSLIGYRITSFILNNMVSLVEAHITSAFNLNCGKKFDPSDLLLPKRNMIRNFLRGISILKKMTIASDTLEVIYNYSRCEPLPVFRYLSSLHADFDDDYRWEMLPIFLQSCLNLKSLTLVFTESPSKEEGVSILPGTRRFLTSLEYVEIVQPMVDEMADKNLVTYLLMNSTNLKEFTYRLVDCDSRKKDKNELDVILKNLNAIPRLSTSCQVIVL